MLMSQIVLTSSVVRRMTTTRQFDLLNRLTQISNTGGTGSTQASFSYTYNEANQRVRVDLADGSLWVYEYDFQGQVISGKRYWWDGTPVAGQQFEYGFDDIGNRKVARRGGDENGWNLRESLYGVNVLNQYTNQTVQGFADVVGVALATKPVYVNGQMASRKGEYFRRELSVNNVGGPVWLGVTVTSPGEPTVTGNLFVPRTPEVFTHDLDGNLTSDGRWTYTWDGENRLLRVQSRSDTPQGSWRRVEWQYDALGRRIRQTTRSWLVQSNLWVVTEDVRMVSDPLLFGRHVIELNASNNALVRSYVWGLDLSETMDGAGGVGGLLWVSNFKSPIGTHFVGYDGNGNVVALVSATSGSETARYEYGPFGEALRVTGSAANQNPFRFSTKRTCNTTDLVLYEYRAYNPVLGRWLSRDPIDERAFRVVNWGLIPMSRQVDKESGLFIALYSFVGNMPFAIDAYGLRKVNTGVKKCAKRTYAGHKWIEYPGGSCGYYPTDSIWWSPGKVENLDPHSSDSDKECWTIEADECALNVKKFVACIQNSCRPRTEGHYQVLIHNCWFWANDTLNMCIAAARK